MKPAHSLVLIAIGLLFCASAGAQIYKWVDGDGRVQYSDSPPQQNQAAGSKSLLDDNNSGGTMSVIPAYQPVKIRSGQGPPRVDVNQSSSSSSIGAGKFRNKLRSRIERAKNRIRHSGNGTVTETTIE